MQLPVAHKFPMLWFVPHAGMPAATRVHCSISGCMWSDDVVDVDAAVISLELHLTNEHHPLAVHQES